MVEYEVGFDRPNGGSICDELATFMRLQFSETIEETIETNDEIAFGIIKSGNRVEKTENIKGIGGTIPDHVINMVNAGLDGIGLDGDRCICHTHRLPPEPSSSDIETLMYFMKPTDEAGKIDKDIPVFDCMFILGTNNMEVGIVNGFIIKEKPSEDKYERMEMEYFKEKQMTGTGKEKRKRLKNKFVELANGYVDICSAIFPLDKPKGD